MEQNVQPGGYAPPPPPAAPNPTNGMAIAALVCGILGIVGAFIPGVAYFTLVLAVLGIIFGVIGMKKAKEIGTGNGLAISGLVLGIVGTIFSLVGVICLSWVACQVKKGFDLLDGLA